MSFWSKTKHGENKNTKTFADNDFLEESNEYIRQVTNVESVTKGGISDITILDGVQGYNVGD